MEDAPAQAPTIAELAANALAAQLQAQIDAIHKCQSKARAEQAAAAESATPSMSHSGRSILRLEGQQRDNLLGRLRNAKKTTNHFIPTFLARLRRADVHAHAPMTTGAPDSSALNAFGRATSKHLDMLLGTNHAAG